MVALKFDKGKFAGLAYRLHEPKLAAGDTRLDRLI